jgi:hypothetical protein
MTMRMTINKAFGFFALSTMAIAYYNRLHAPRMKQLVKEQKLRDLEAIERVRQGGNIRDN